MKVYCNIDRAFNPLQEHCVFDIQILTSESKHQMEQRNYMNYNTISEQLYQTELPM